MPRDLFIPSPCSEFVVTHCAALACAAALLGGSGAERRVRLLVDDLNRTPLLTPRLKRELDAIEDLLALRHVHDVDRLEAERFMQIDPADPAVEDICLLLDGLRAARAVESCTAA
ncbi:hypothetical protein [Aquicoccus sp. SU-CL01552]|uniref:hypothetical protein n=1 Tax=Aquicoccus sp. SU-CL01552 TaxID=3127656 RepID=UPI0031038E1B